MLNLASPSSLTKISAITLMLAIFLPSFGGKNGKHEILLFIYQDLDFCRKVGFGNFHLRNGNSIVPFFQCLAHTV